MFWAGPRQRSFLAGFCLSAPGRKRKSVAAGARGRAQYNIPLVSVMEREIGIQASLRVFEAQRPFRMVASVAQSSGSAALGQH